MYPEQDQKPKSAKSSFPARRMRRLRSAGWIREMVQEHSLKAADLILPVFVTEGQNREEPIASMPGVNRASIDLTLEQVKQAADLGIPAIALFPVTPPEKKNERGSEAINPDNLICRAIQAIKSEIPNIGIITDVALDPYTSHGHDGVLCPEGKILNDESVEILARQALVQSQAGADIIAPSDMMDGRIAAIRRALDNNAQQDTAILSYAAKYASGFYGPFRDAVNSSSALKNNKLGDKKTYQMNPANSNEAIHEVALDIEEGADMIMVKPGLPYLDIIHRIKTRFEMPTFAYHVSGEFAMLKAAAGQGWLDYDTCLMESLMAFKRAGCDGILSYGALDAAKLLSKK